MIFLLNSILAKITLAALIFMVIAPLMFSLNNLLAICIKTQSKYLFTNIYKTLTMNTISNLTQFISVYKIQEWELSSKN